MTRSLYREVAAIIEERGPSTLDDIAPRFPDIERRVVQKAMANAKAAGLLDTLPITQVGTWGSPMATYVAASKDEPLRPGPDNRPPRGVIPNVNSVFALAGARPHKRAALFLPNCTKQE